MINLGGYYSVDAEKVDYVAIKNGGSNAPYGLFLVLSSGQEIGVWYQTEDARQRARETLVRQLEMEKGCKAQLENRLILIWNGIDKLEKRQLRIYRQLRKLLGTEVPE